MTHYTSYDGIGNVIAKTDGRGYTIDSIYDDANRPVQMLAPNVQLADGTLLRPTTSTMYDNNGNIVTVTDPNNKVTTNTYDALNRLLTTTDAEGIVVNYTYDPIGNKLTVKDGKNQVTTLTYDGLNRNLTTIDPAGQTTTLLYDALNKISRTDALGQITEYNYDNRNRLTATTYPARPIDNRTMTYDNVGNLLTVTELGKNGKTDVVYTYDALNRQITEVSGGLTHYYTYDLAGNRTQTQFGGTNRLITSTYDALNRLDTMKEVGRTTQYRYDLNGNIVLKLLPNGDRTEGTFDAFNRMMKSDGKNVFAALLYSYTNHYDPAGNVTKIEESYTSGLTSRTVEMTYDSVYRLLTEKVAEGINLSTTSYTYDAAHNRASRTKSGVTANYTYNNLNQLTQWSDGSQTVIYTYDLNGNRKTKSESGITQQYSYDIENRLLNVTKSAKTYGFTYDYRTRRVERAESAKPTTTFIFSGGTECLEKENNAFTVENIRGSDYGGGIGGILYTLRGGSPSFTHYNRRGDVVAKTDSGGSLTYQAKYEAFGTRTQESGTTQDRQKANTKDEEPDLGLLNEGFRYRDLDTGAFITRDPLGFVDGPNMYTYVVGNPWTKFDPMGLEEDEPEAPEQPADGGSGGGDKGGDKPAAPTDAGNGEGAQTPAAPMPPPPTTSGSPAEPPGATPPSTDPSSSASDGVDLGNPNAPSFAGDGKSISEGAESLRADVEAAGGMAAYIEGGDPGLQAPLLDPTDMLAIGKGVLAAGMLGLVKMAEREGAEGLIEMGAKGSKSLWPKSAQEMNDFLKIEGKSMPDTLSTSGRDKTVWEMGGSKITFERHPYHPNAPSYHKDYHWHLDTPSKSHQRFLPGDPIPGY